MHWKHCIQTPAPDEREDDLHDNALEMQNAKIQYIVEVLARYHLFLTKLFRQVV